ncbi:MAG: UDP-glucose 4-epimerase [Pseudohongiellaceae bacterium]|jgi:UDP-glucose 4-epimerase
MTRVLVTGGAGFIGSHIAEALLARGDQVVVVDDFSSGYQANLPEGVQLVRGDLADLEVARAAVKGCDQVVHCAAQPSVIKSVEDPITSNRCNLGSATSLVVAAREAGVQRIVYSGSSAVYGDRVEGSASEDAREAPVSPYGMNKLAAEQLFRMCPELFGIDTVCLRYFNVFGPRQDPSSPYSGVISIFVMRALAGKSPMIYGDGLQTRDFTYVSDIVSANLAALDVPSGDGKVVNVGGGVGISLMEVWNTIREVCGRPELEADHGEARLGDIVHSRAAVEVAHSTLGFSTQVSLADGLSSTVAWYRSRPNSDS